MTGKLRQKYALLCCCVATADHKYFLSRKELPVTGGAVGNTSTLVFFLTFESDGSWVGSGCQQNTKTAIIAFIGANGLDIPVEVKAGGLCQQKFRAEALRLLLNGIRQSFAAGLVMPG